MTMSASDAVALYASVGVVEPGESLDERDEQEIFEEVQQIVGAPSDLEASSFVDWWYSGDPLVLVRRIRKRWAERQNLPEPVCLCPTCRQPVSAKYSVSG